MTEKCTKIVQINDFCGKQVNMKFGKPTKEELQMTVYEPEPEAEAVVLCRLTDVEYTVQMTSYLVDYHEKVPHQGAETQRRALCEGGRAVSGEYVGRQ